MLPPHTQAARHNAYGVRPYHYSSVGEVLLFTLEKMLGAGFTAEVKQAWLKLYRSVFAPPTLPSLTAWNGSCLQPADGDHDPCVGGARHSVP